MSKTIESLMQATPAANQWENLPTIDSRAISGAFSVGCKVTEERFKIKSAKGVTYVGVMTDHGPVIYGADYKVHNLPESGTVINVQPSGWTFA